MPQNLSAKRAKFSSESADSPSYDDSRFRRSGPWLASCAFAISALTFATAPTLAGCNSGNVANTALLSSANCQADAPGNNATAIGRFAVASGSVYSTTFGYGSGATFSYTTAIGAIAGAVADTSTAVGASSSAAGVGSIVIGAFAGGSGTGTWSVAIGAGPQNDKAAKALGPGSIAIGGGESATFVGARASGNAAVAIGNRSVASGEGYASAFGYNARADVGLAPTAIGTDSTAKGTNAAAFGRFSLAAVENSTALGSGAQAKKKGSVAIGFASIAAERNVVSVGSADLRRRITNVANAASPTDAVNLRQVKQMIAAAATVAAMPVAAEAPAVSVVAVGRQQSVQAIEDLRRQLADLKALVREQQQRIERLEGRSVAATPSAR